ncbi:MAG TPA: cytochrome c oxidase subunit II [Capillimicrobium sp.]|nr:cytochrome c oxidase subunit II [Capillimicrobium sp.]
MAPINRRHIFTAVLLAVVAGCLALAPAAMADFFTPEDGGSPNADRIDTLYKIVFAVGVVVFIGVEGTLLYTLIKFRARKGAVAAQIHGNTRLEIGWTVGAALILVVLATVTFVALPGIRDPENSSAEASALVMPVSAHGEKRVPPDGKALNIEVTGMQYVWRYTYPDGDDNPLNNPYSYEEMVVPVGATVTLDIRATDVAHSWWIPELGGKMDAIPGYTNYAWFKATKPGVFRGQCAELCGRNHANMIAQVRAVPPAEYQQYIERLRNDIAAANADAAESRRKLDADPQATP